MTGDAGRLAHDVRADPALHAGEVFGRQLARAIGRVACVGPALRALRALRVSPLSALRS